jgi:hypothetical protein
MLVMLEITTNPRLIISKDSIEFNINLLPTFASQLDYQARRDGKHESFRMAIQAHCGCIKTFLSHQLGSNKTTEESCSKPRSIDSPTTMKKNKRGEEWNAKTMLVPM